MKNWKLHGRRRKQREHGDFDEHRNAARLQDHVSRADEGNRQLLPINSPEPSKILCLLLLMILIIIAFRIT